jgi:hypothetical protein
VPVRLQDLALAVGPEGPIMADKYEGLYKYLEKRYANSVVLTFAQIEDLLGFPLADAARIDRGWWSNDAPHGPQQAQSRAWTRASRIATPNLGAQTVRFERAQD